MAGARHSFGNLCNVAMGGYLVVVAITDVALPLSVMEARLIARATLEAPQSASGHQGPLGTRITAPVCRVSDIIFHGRRDMMSAVHIDMSS